MLIAAQCPVLLCRVLFHVGQQPITKIISNNDNAQKHAGLASRHQVHVDWLSKTVSESQEFAEELSASRRTNAYKATLLMSKAQRSGKRQCHVVHVMVCPTHSALARVTPRSSSADATCETAALGSITVDCAVGQTEDNASCPLPQHD